MHAGGNHGGDGRLHIAVLPWLAMGHIIPYLHLAKRLSQKGLRISFISTPRNITTILTTLLPNPAAASPAIDFVPIPSPSSPVESTMNIKPSDFPRLKAAFATLREPVAAFLRDAIPDVVLYDYCCDWVPPIAAEIGALSGFLSIFNASTLCFIGPPERLVQESNEDLEVLLRAWTTNREWIPFESNMRYYLHEIKRMLASQGGNGDSKEGERWARAIGGGAFVAVKTSVELESKWIDLLKDLYKKPVIQIGTLFPVAGNDDGHDGWGEAAGIKDWLDGMGDGSVIYVALGTEAILDKDEITEMAHGLEDSAVPFLWVLRDLPESTQTAVSPLPSGFQERVEGRGMVYTAWAPQVKVLGHRAIGGFLTHCGWSSVIEGLGFGRVLVLLPMINDQPLIARMLTEEGLGLELVRQEKDRWSLARDEIAGKVRAAMVTEEGAVFREKARKMKGIVGNEELNDRYVEDFIHRIEQMRQVSKQ
ncbi:hypothetical protein Drorol1_Dr00018353 [Drosera rotundifolia]